MDTLRAISSMASAEAAGIDGTRTPAAAALRKQFQHLDIAVNKAIALTEANHLDPSKDQATQRRLAAAVDRQITGGASADQDVNAVTSRIMWDLMLQEAAARRLELEGESDPLAHLSTVDSSREDLQAADILSRNRISAGLALNSASKDDLSSIAAGRYDRIESDHARQSIGMMLSLSEKQMATPTRAISPDMPQRPIGNYQNFPVSGLGIRPASVRPPVFGNKIGAER